MVFNDIVLPTQGIKSLNKIKILVSHECLTQCGSSMIMETHLGGKTTCKCKVNATI